MSVLSTEDWGRIFAYAWTHEAFRKAYEADPQSALREHAEALGIPADAEFRLPEPPEGMDQEALKKIAEGHDIHPMYCC